MARLVQSLFLKLPKPPPEAHMAEIQPFRAYRYDTNRVRSKDVLTQPYDKITPGDAGAILRGEPLQFDCHRKGARVPERYSGKQRLHPRGAESRRMDRAENSGAGRGARHLRLLAGISGSRNAHAPRRASVSSRWAAWRITTRRSSSATSARFRRRKPTASNCCATRARRPASFSCCTTIQRAAVDTLLEEVARKHPRRTK